jgi:hypothetical protein
VRSPETGVLSHGSDLPQMRQVGDPSFRLKNGCTQDDAGLWDEKPD